MTYRRATEHLELVTDLVTVVPVTTVDRGWPNHVPVAGHHTPQSASWAMTEQARTASRARVHASAGSASPACMHDITIWVHDFIAAPINGDPA